MHVFLQVFHWLVEDRVDYIEVTPSVSRLAHVRIVSFLLVLLVRMQDCRAVLLGRKRAACSAPRCAVLTSCVWGASG